jgi:hypothetical protein
VAVTKSARFALPWRCSRYSSLNGIAQQERQFGTDTPTKVALAADKALRRVQSRARPEAGDVVFDMYVRNGINEQADLAVSCRASAPTPFSAIPSGARDVVT